MRDLKVRGYAVEEMVGSQWIIGTGIFKREFTEEFAEQVGKKADFFVFGESGWVEVHEKSIGQYIGLKNKKHEGVDLFEGDIVIARSQGLQGTFKIKWRQEGAPMWMLYPAWQANRTWNLHGTLNDNGEWFDKVEIIGNVFEHPHLLEVPDGEKR